MVTWVYTADKQRANLGSGAPAVTGRRASAMSRSRDPRSSARAVMRDFSANLCP
jgi:hypothetical protein